MSKQDRFIDGNLIGRRDLNLCLHSRLHNTEIIHSLSKNEGDYGEGHKPGWFCLRIGVSISFLPIQLLGFLGKSVLNLYIRFKHHI